MKPATWKTCKPLHPLRRLLLSLTLSQNRPLHPALLPLRLSPLLLLLLHQQPQPLLLRQPRLLFLTTKPTFCAALSQTPSAASPSLKFTSSTQPTRLASLIPVPTLPPTPSVR